MIDPINSHSEFNKERSETTARVKSLEASKTIAEEASKNAKELQKENGLGYNRRSSRWRQKRKSCIKTWRGGGEQGK